MSAQLISEFDIWRPGYSGAAVSVFIAGTTTLASLFADEGLTQPLQNPQILDSLIDNQGYEYGKFNNHIYTGQAYYLSISGGEETGIKRPQFSSLNGESAENTTVKIAGSAAVNTLGSIVRRTVHAENYGVIEIGGSGSAATNTATISSAIGALTSGGRVVLPAGLIKINALSLPQNVRLKGAAKNATTLQVIVSGNAFTLNGDYAGFEDITLDGNVLAVGSIGIYAVNKNEITFENVVIQNFETGLYLKGGKRHRYRNLDIDNCKTGAKLYGDTDAGNGGGGGEFLGNSWNGGRISNCTTIGISMSYEDAKCSHLTFRDLAFETNTGTAVKINGAQFIEFARCRWTANTANVDIQDDTDVLTGAKSGDNIVISVGFSGGQINAGTFKVKNTAQDIVLHSMAILGVAFTLSTPILNCILLDSCYEDSNVSISGEGTKFRRDYSTNVTESTGLTTDAAPTKAWSIVMQPGQLVHIAAQVLAKQRNGTGRAIFYFSFGAYCTGASLAYDTQTTNYVVGDILTGQSSGATGRIIADTDGGATGTLTLTDVVGVFLDNEIITGSSAGSAMVNGVLAPGGIAIDTIGAVNLRNPYSTDPAWGPTAVATGSEVQINVTGSAAKTVEWTVRANLAST